MPYFDVHWEEEVSHVTRVRAKTQKEAKKKVRLGEYNDITDDRVTWNGMKGSNPPGADNAMTVSKVKTE